MYIIKYKFLPLQIIKMAEPEINTEIPELGTGMEEFDSKAFDDLLKEHKILTANVDSLFLIIMGIIVFLMQCGFALLEAGAVRSKNTVNILIKNMLDCLIGGLFYWGFGWALAYGDNPSTNGFIGTHQFFSHGLEHKDYPSWFFQFVFAATTATIVSGSIAERCSMTAYFMYSILLTGKNLRKSRNFEKIRTDTLKIKISTT